MILKKLCILIIFLPIFSYGQGFYKLSEKLIDSIAAHEVNELDLMFSEGDLSFFLETNKFNVLSFENNNFTTIPINDEYAFSSILKDEELLYSLRRPNIIKYQIKDGVFEKKKSIRLPKRLIDRSFTATASFQDEEFIYFICYYNKNQIVNNHDNSYWIKVSKDKFKVVDYKEIFVGKEILLAPMNMQQIAFNQKYFMLSSPMKHELYLIDKSFNVYDTVRLNEELAVRNTAKFDSVFPNSTLFYYAGKPKQVIDRAFNSGLLTTDILEKVVCINDSLIALSTVIEQRERYRLQIYNLNTRTVIWENEFTFRDTMFGDFAFTTKLFFLEESKFTSIRNVAVNDSSEFYMLTIYGFTPEQQLKREVLDNHQIIDKNLQSIDISRYSAVILADYTYCKACYIDYGIGEDVLVLYKQEVLEKSRLYTTYKSLKREWNIHGEIGFVDEETFDSLQRSMKRNTIIPLTKENGL